MATALSAFSGLSAFRTNPHKDHVPANAVLWGDGTPVLWGDGEYLLWTA